MTYRDPYRHSLDEAADEVRSELARIDAKASMLLALSAAVATVVVASGLLASPGQPGWLARAGMAAVGLAVVVLLATARPSRLRHAPFAQCVAAPHTWQPEPPRQRVVNLSTLAYTKFRRVRLSVDLMALSGLLLATSAIWAGVS